MELDFPHAVLLGLSLVILAWGVWAVIWPRAAQKGAGWWLRVGPRVSTLTGVVLFAVAAVLWVVVLIDQDWVYRVLAVLAALSTVLGLGHFGHGPTGRSGTALLVRWPTGWARLAGVVAGLLASVMLWVALTGR